MEVRVKGEHLDGRGQEEMLQMTKVPGYSLYIVKVNLRRRARSGEKNYFTGDQL